MKTRVPLASHFVPPDDGPLYYHSEQRLLYFSGATPNPLPTEKSTGRSFYRIIQKLISSENSVRKLAILAAL